VAKLGNGRRTTDHRNWSATFREFGLTPREENTDGRTSSGPKKRSRERLDARLLVAQMASDARKDDSSRIFALLRRFLRDSVSRADASWNDRGRKLRLGPNIGFPVPERDAKDSQPP
jgi:hypothetical protein